MTILRMFLFCWLAQCFTAIQVTARAKNKTVSDTLVNKFLFIEWQHKDSTVILGMFSNKGKKREAQFASTINNLKKEDVDRWLGESSNGALLLFHCMWGQQPGFHQKKYLQSIDQILMPQPLSGIHTEISFIWHAGGVLYRKNWNAAAAKGEPLGQLLQWVAEHYNYNMHALCHSMGNRFFEGIIRSIPEAAHLFKSITFFSADLENLSTDSDFIRCKNATDRLYIYIHRKDRFLLLSYLLHGRKRLGRSGPFPQNAGCTVVDMTTHASGLQNHTHINKPWVQAQISCQLLYKN